MVMALIEHQDYPKPHKFNNFIGKNYELAINQSIQSLLDSLHIPIANLSDITSSFLELMQAKPDPPLETIWVFSGLTYHSNNSPKEEHVDQFSAVKDLFQSITASSASCSSSKSVALIAPVIYELYRLIVDLKVKGVGFKKETKVRRKINSFLDVILGYINLCYCEGRNDDEGLRLIRPLSDLVSVWIEQVVGNEGEEGFRLFFPLLGDQIIKWIGSGCCGISELAGAVTAEAFFLRLCLKFGEGSSKMELQNELRSWAVCSITGFGNSYLFDMLVMMLLEPSLHVASLLNSEDEIFIRKVLYDAVILAEYSFLKSDSTGRLPAEHMTSVAVARLMVTIEAVEIFRGNGEHAKAISYINAFSSSHLPSQLIKWVKSESGMAGKASGPNGSSPKAILQWLLDLEDQGIKLFDDELSKYRARLLLNNVEAHSEQPRYNGDGEKSDNDVLFYIDNKGKVEDGDEEEDEKMNESMSAVFVAAAHTMQSMEDDSRGRKRKERRGAGKKKQVKFHRFDLFDHFGSSGDKATVSRKNNSDSGSEVENPYSDEDLEVKEQ